MCDCIAKIDERLARDNSRLVTVFTFTPGATLRVKLPTEKINPRNRNRMGALATFCPFCGEPYEPAVAAPEGVA